MQKTTKLLSLFLALGMLLSVAVPTASAKDMLSFSDVSSDHEYYSAITSLAAEGIINGFEDGTFKPEEPVTRAQYTKLICMAQGAGNLTYSEADKAKFPDVAMDHWALNFITTAKNSGIINGHDDGTFKPEDSVLYEQAVKMTVCALGYTEANAIRAAGGLANPYPQGYLSLASKAKLLNHIRGVKIGEALTRGRVAQLIYNFLDAELYDAEEGTTGGTVRDEISSTRKQAEGRIVAVYGSSIYHDEQSECNKKQIELELDNGKREFYGIAELSIDNIHDYLGRSVVVYYNYESGEEYYEAYSITLQKKKNDEYKVNLEDIESFNGSSLAYWNEDGDDTEKLSIADDIIVIRNGQAVDETFQDVVKELSGKPGFMTLVCSQNNDSADIAFVRTYETIFLSGGKDNKNYKVSDYYDNTKFFVLDETDRNKTITFTKDGEATNFSGIPSTCVISVSQSKNGKLIDVQISTKTQKGTVTDILDNECIKLNTTGDTVYRFTENCYKSDALTAGSYATLYLDAFGNIGRYVMSAEKTYEFGYLVAAEFGTMTNPVIEAKIMRFGSNSSGTDATTYTFKDKIKIDNQTYDVSKDADQIKALLLSNAEQAGVNVAIQGSKPTNATYAQPVRFITDNSKNVEAILTQKATGEPNVSLNLNVDYMTTPITCSVGGSKLGQFDISNAKIMVVPADRMGGTYSSKSASYFKKDESYYVQLVNVSSTYQPAAVYVYGTKAGGSDATIEVISEDNIPMIVTKVFDALYQEQSRKKVELLGADGSKLDVYDDGRKGTEALLTVAVGDVIRVAADSDGFVDAIEVLATAKHIVDGTEKTLIHFDGTTNNTDDMEAPMRTVVGLVHSAKENTLLMAPSFTYPAPGSVDIHNYTCGDDTKYFMVDTTASDNIIVEESLFSEIYGEEQSKNNGSHVMVYTKDAEVVAVIIFQ